MSNFLNRTTLEYVESVNDPLYPNTDWVKNPDLSPVSSVEKHWWVLDGDTLREATDAEKLSAIDEHRDRTRVLLIRAVNEYGNEHYTDADEMRLGARYEEAHRLGLTDRVALIGSALAWRDAVLAEYSTRYIAIMAAQSIEEIDAVSMDFSQFDDTDPEVSLTAVLAVTT